MAADSGAVGAGHRRWMRVVPGLWVAVGGDGVVGAVRALCGVYDVVLPQSAARAAGGRGEHRFGRGRNGALGAVCDGRRWFAGERGGQGVLPRGARGAYLHLPIAPACAREPSLHRRHGEAVRVSPRQASVDDG